MRCCHRFFLVRFILPFEAVVSQCCCYSVPDEAELTMESWDAMQNVVFAINCV